MKKAILFLFFSSLMITITEAQFVESGEIEFEVKTNIRKTMGNSAWAEMMKDKLPAFKSQYCTYTFNKNKSMYRFKGWENKESIPEMFRKSDEKSVWYTDFDKDSILMQKDVFGSAFNVGDTLPKLHWKLTNENRIIAGYNCRKAVGQMMDSVYVFAFYTDEIIIPGGPCSINGLPGMILGVTIPRLYSSWIATKVTPMQDVSDWQKPIAVKNIFSRSTAYNTIVEKTKGWSENSDDPESRKWLDQLIWNLLL